MRLDATLRLQNDVYSPRYNRPQAGYGRQQFTSISYTISRDVMDLGVQKLRIVTRTEWHVQ